MKGKMRECILQTAVHIPEWENGSSVRVCELHSHVRAWSLYTHSSIPEQLCAATVDKVWEFLVFEAHTCPRLMRIKWQGQNVNLAGSFVPCSPLLVPSASLTAGFCWFWCTVASSQMYFALLWICSPVWWTGSKSKTRWMNKQTEALLITATHSWRHHENTPSSPLIST